MRKTSLLFIVLMMTAVVFADTKTVRQPEAIETVTIHQDGLLISTV